tara:strand:+ start:413 stop:646 length:234 start_codon:yes stop_codon:yes gene_type:complete
MASKKQLQNDIIRLEMLMDAEIMARGKFGNESVRDKLESAYVRYSDKYGKEFTGRGGGREYSGGGTVKVMKNFKGTF